MNLRDINSAEALSEEIRSRYYKDKKNILVLLIGGCSRTGKSTLAEKLFKLLAGKKLNSIIISLDNWLVDIEKRKNNSSVKERYDTVAIVDSIKKILAGENIFPPIYNPETRKRINEFNNNPIKIDSGILIIEGVISLSIKELNDISKIRVFIEISDCLRLKRLIEFYSSFKKVSRPVCKSIILSREREEIPFIKKSSENATIIFRWGNRNNFLYQ